MNHMLASLDQEVDRIKVNTPGEGPAGTQENPLWVSSACVFDSRLGRIFFWPSLARTPLLCRGYLAFFFFSAHSIHPEHDMICELDRQLKKPIIAMAPSDIYLCF